MTINNPSDKHVVLTEADWQHAKFLISNGGDLSTLQRLDAMPVDARVILRADEDAMDALEGCKMTDIDEFGDYAVDTLGHAFACTDPYERAAYIGAAQVLATLHQGRAAHDFSDLFDNAMVWEDVQGKDEPFLKVRVRGSS